MSSAEHPLVVVGARDDAARRIHEAGANVGVPLAVAAHLDDIASALADVEPLAIVLRLDAKGAAQACAHIRSQARLAKVPIFGLVDELNDLAFTELFVWGGDDLVGWATSQPLARRLRALRPSHAAAQARPAATPVQHAIVAGTEATWRTVMARSLYHGGFAVRFATSGDGLLEECLREDAQIVVVTDDLEPHGAVEALRTARARGAKAACVLVAPPKRMAAANAAVKELGKASVADGFAAPENVLFLVNELLAARGVDKRASPRLLYGTAVAFRAAGREEDEVGFSYNISGGGLYVRTLAPLEPKQEVWLEMWPPRSERRVRLAGTVAWRRPFGPVGGATVPAGFGVHITDGLAGDFDRWRAGYDAFLTSILGTERAG
ncbi:MAG TPA: PilZ domain-containing protein [Polyangiaceae bacterium]|nr:PilZ domain-containing protein [Polyangiaceae bacterium]